MKLEHQELYEDTSFETTKQALKISQKEKKNKKNENTKTKKRERVLIKLQLYITSKKTKKGEEGMIFYFLLPP